MTITRTHALRKRFVANLNDLHPPEIHHLLKAETTEELCALVEHAPRHLQQLIIREIRNTDD